MLPKPDACRGCPLYQDGHGFVPDEIVEGANVFVLGQNPGAEEERDGRPFVGRTGAVMMQEFFPRAALVRGENVSIGNALRCRLLKDGRRTNALPAGAELRRAIKHCTTAHLRVPASTKLLVAQGAVAWNACGNTNTLITDWRGFLAPEPLRRADGESLPVLGTLHPADLFRDPKMRIPSHRDWAKVPRFLEGTWPLPLPKRLEFSWDAGAESWWRDAMGAPFLVIDTEYDRATKALYLIGLGVPKAPVLQARWPALSYVLKDRFTARLRAAVKHVPVVFQNAPADVPVLKQNLGIDLQDFAQIDDTMLAHSVLWSEWPHALEFLASIYGIHPKMKHLARSNPMLYNAGDVVDTIAAWEGMRDEFEHDPASWRVYRTQPIPLLSVVIRAHERGIRVNAARVESAAQEYQQKMKQARGLAQAYVGRPDFNVGSDDQLRQVLYDHEGFPIQKHKATKKPSVDADSIAELRRRVEPLPDFEREAREGLTWDDVERRIEQGGHPLLETRVFYAAARQAYSHYILPCFVDGDPAKSVVTRLHPEFHLHAQANARWSTVHPPMAQLPSDLRDIVCPDEGTGWLGWDWDQAELRLNAALCHDTPSLDAFRNGEDIHTLNACDVFGLAYPLDRRDPHAAVVNSSWRQKHQWTGKDDPRRIFAKRFVYRLDYGGDPAQAGDIPGAKALGLDARALVQASHRYLAAHPAKREWRMQTRLRINRPPRGTLPTSETFLGRKRRILVSGPAAARVAFNYPMQAGVADIANVTAVRIDKELPWLDFMYQMHDGWWYQCPLARIDETWAPLKAIVEAEWDVYGVTLTLPATYKERRV